jgi:hypothetical protein
MVLFLHHEFISDKKNNLKPIDLSGVSFKVLPIMNDQKKNQDKFDKRAANLRANLLKRKEQSRKNKEQNETKKDDT